MLHRETRGFCGRWGAPLLLIAAGCKATGGDSDPDPEPDSAPGPFVAYHADGSKAEEGALVAGQQEGRWTYYHENGRKKAEGRCEADLQVGEWKYWYASGQLEMLGSFDRQRLTGEWLYYSESGALTAKGRFRDGLQDGLWFLYTDDGVLESRGFYNRGRQSYGWTYWYPDGSLKATGFYDRGDKVDTWIYYDEDGGASTRGYGAPLDSSDRPYEVIVDRWEDGTIRREGFAQGGLPVGGWTTRHRNGNLRSAGRFLGGRPEGFWRLWTGDGTTEIRGELVGGRRAPGWERVLDGRAQPLPRSAPRAIAPFRGEWSSADLAEQALPNVVAETWLAEAASPPSASNPVAFPQILPAPDLEASVAQNGGAPAPSSTLSPAQKGMIEGIVGSFTDLEEGAAAEGDVELAQALLGRRVDGEFFTGDPDRPRTELGDGSGNILLIILRGFFGDVCVCCVSQAGAYGGTGQRYGAYQGAEEQLEALNTRSYLMYPGPADGVKEFQRIYCDVFGMQELPATVVYDLSMKFIDSLGIGDSELARPTTLLLDRERTVRWAYVGTNPTDRPPIELVLEKIRAIEEGAGAE